jgi:hypothetical protein
MVTSRKLGQVEGKKEIIEGIKEEINRPKRQSVHYAD